MKQRDCRLWCNDVVLSSWPISIPLAVVQNYTVSEKGATLFSTITLAFLGRFLQRGRIACNAERRNTYSNSVCPSVRPSVRLSVRHTLVRNTKNSLFYWSNALMWLRSSARDVYRMLRCLQRYWCKNLISPLILVASRPSMSSIFARNASLDRPVAEPAGPACRSDGRYYRSIAQHWIAYWISSPKRQYLTTFDADYIEMHHGLHC